MLKLLDKAIINTMEMKSKLFRELSSKGKKLFMTIKSFKAVFVSIVNVLEFNTSIHTQFINSYGLYINQTVTKTFQLIEDQSLQEDRE